MPTTDENKKLRKILFLDVDGVMNCRSTTARHPNCSVIIGVDSVKVEMVKSIISSTGCDVVLSSTWRKSEEDYDIINSLIPLIGATPIMPKLGGAEACERGHEIKHWLDKNGADGIHYAILDDDNDMLPEQQDNFFKTTWEFGITQNIVDDVIKHLNKINT